MSDTNNNTVSVDHQGSDDEQNELPDRPGQPDCLYYLRNRVCGYGNRCRYNHPTAFKGQGVLYRDELPQRDGQADCQFFLRTGTCKFGPTCKYHHPQDKNNGQPTQMNALGLPIREDEKSCPHYMKTGSCKFGIACKFNHPQPASGEAIFTGPSAYGYTGSSVVSSGTPIVSPSSTLLYSRMHPHMQGIPSYWPFAFPSHMQPGWSIYMGNLNISPTHAAGTNLAFASHVPAGSTMTVSLPHRPDKPGCQHYIRTGYCKYGSSCRYYHPIENSQADASTVGPLELPLRPGQPICSFFSTYGNCKYGSSCKFDHHPFVGYYYRAPPFTLLESTTLLTKPKAMQVALTSTENSSSTTPKASPQLMKRESSNESKDLENDELNNKLTQTCSSDAADSDSGHD